MNPSTPSMLYAVQATAYTSHSAYNLRKTNSTPDSPPQVTPTDIVAACNKKKDILNNLPKKCSHCNNDFSKPNETFTELKDGSVIAYCKHSSCGRSQVLFVAPTLTVPKYKKVCVFEEVPGTLESDHDKMLRMHGETPNHAVCQKCGKTWEHHEKDYDENGWKEVGHDTITLPSDWPTLNATTKSWK